MKKAMYQLLEEYDKQNIYPFHMPGHKRNAKVVENYFPVRQDITEISGFDNLHHPQGILREAQDRLAELYGAKQSYYSVNGSTAALLSAVSAAVPRGEKILIARNCHKAVYHAIYLRQLQPVYVFPETDCALGINGGIRPQNVEKLLKKDPDIKAVLITSPTYDGVVSDVAGIAEAAHRYQIPLIVDEAHGAHFRFSDRFPASAVGLGADLVIQSLHKTLPSMTQTAVLHRCTGRVEKERLQQFMGIYQSSSPSYVLMASVDACVETLKRDGTEMFRRFTDDLLRLRERLSENKRIRLITPEKSSEKGIYDYDRSKVLLSAEGGSLNGHRLHRMLREVYGLELEMETEQYVLALTSVGDTRDGFDRLARAVEEIDRKLQQEENPSERPAEQTGSGSVEVPCQKLIPAQAMDAQVQRVSLEESVGRISAEFVYLYPPGIPLLVPGEVMTGQILKNMRRYIEQGLDLQGPSDLTNNSLLVVRREAE